jgi:hypothetical protein
MQAKICQNTFIHSMLVLAASNSYAQTYMEPIGGKPPAGSKCSESDLSFRVKYQRAFEAVLWSLPAVANYRFRMGGFSHIGYNDNAIVAYSAPVSPKFESLTADPTEPFIGVCTNLKRGPVCTRSARRNVRLKFVRTSDRCMATDYCGDRTFRFG